MKTPLYDFHAKLGAKFTEFAGWTMPLSYPLGTLKEHIHTRSRAGLFDVSHMGVIRVTGMDRESFIEKLLPIDVKEMTCGQVRYSFLLNESGGTIDDLLVTKFEEELILVINAGCKEKDYEHLKGHLGDFNVHIDLLAEVCILALQGPKAESVMHALWPDVSTLGFMKSLAFEWKQSNIYVSRTGYTGEDGFEIILPTSVAESVFDILINHPEVASIGLAARDTLRLEAALCLYGHELNENISPLDAGLLWAIAKKRREEWDFIGAKALQSASVSQQERLKRVGVMAPDRIMIREGIVLFDSQSKEVGTISSGGYSPMLGKSIGMGYVPFNTHEEHYFIEVRSQKVKVNVVTLPFVPHCYRN